MINTLIVDLSQTTADNIHKHHVKTVQDVYKAPMLVAFSKDIRQKEDELKSFLMKNLYRHYKVMRMSSKASLVIKELFAAFLENPRLLPNDYQKKDEDKLVRSIADYIAGMTDRYAIKEHRRLFKI